MSGGIKENRNGQLPRIDSFKGSYVWQSPSQNDPGHQLKTAKSAPPFQTSRERKEKEKLTIKTGKSLRTYNLEDHTYGNFHVKMIQTTS